MTLDEIREYFRTDKYMSLTGIEIDEVGDYSCVCSLKIKPEEHYNAGGTVQGGVIFTFADSALGVACNSNFLINGEKLITLNLSSSITYIKAGTTGTIYAHAQRISSGRKNSTYKIDVTEEDGTLLATMTANGYTVPKKN